MKQFMVLALSFVLAASAVAAPQDAPATGVKKPRRRAALVNPVTKRLDEMEQAINAQQQQIQQLMQELQSRDAAIQQLLKPH